MKNKSVTKIIERVCLICRQYNGFYSSLFEKTSSRYKIMNILTTSHTLFSNLYIHIYIYIFFFKDS